MYIWPGPWCAIPSPVSNCVAGELSASIPALRDDMGIGLTDRTAKIFILLQIRAVGTHT
jgi:hypothetical protein